MKQFNKVKNFKINFTQNSEKLKVSPNKTNINICKEQKIISKTSKINNKFFKAFLGKKKKEESKKEEKKLLLNNMDNIYNKENGKIFNEEQENNKKLLLNKLSDSKKKDLLDNLQNSIKCKTLKNEIQKKIQRLKSGGYNIEEFSYSLDNLLKNQKKKKINLNKERNIIREIMTNNNNINNTKSSKKKLKILDNNKIINTNNIDNRRLYNKSKRLFTSYSNVNILYHDKRKKTPISAIKSKIDTFEFINKIKKRISPDKKIIFNTHMNNNSHSEDFDNMESNNIKHIINDYIKIKRKERKENEIKNKEKRNKENLKKYNNFVKLQENIKDSIINKKKIEEEKEKNNDDKIEIFDNTNKSSIFNEKEYYINCYETQNIYKDNFKNINYSNLKDNKLCQSFEYHINLNKIRNRKIKTKNQFCNNYLIRNNCDLKNSKLFNKIHISNLLIKKNTNKKKEENKYKLFIEKIILIMKNTIKRKYFKLLMYLNIITKIIRIIKKIPFSKLIQYNKNNKVIKLKNIIYKIVLKTLLNKVKLYAYNKKNYIFLIKIKNIYIKNCYIYFISKLKDKINSNKDIKNLQNLIESEKENDNINKYNNLIENQNIKEIKEIININIINNNENILNKEPIQNIISNNTKNIFLNNNSVNNKNKTDENIKIIIGDEKESLFLKKENKPLIENKSNNINNITLNNNIFFHNKEIFKNLRYEDEDDFFDEDSQMEEKKEILKNINTELKIDIKEEEKENEENNEIKNYFNKIPKNIKDNIEKELTEEIIKEIIDIEIKNKAKIIQKKSSINEFNKKHKDTIVNTNITNSNSNNNSQLDSSVESSMNISLLKKSVGEIKEGKKLNKYYMKKFPIFLKMIEKDIKKNYIDIINNLKKPLIIDEEKYINQISELINKKKNNNNNLDFELNNENEDEINDQKNTFLYKFKIPYNNKDLIKTKFIDEKILKDFNIKNEMMNEKSNEETINVSKYDTFLNKCVYDSANEIIEKRRMYGHLGIPVLWSDRNKIVKYKYDESKYSKKLFVKEIINELKEIINKKIGLIPENYDYMSLENLISDREKKFNKNIHDDLIENEEKDNNIDLVFSASLITISKAIIEQLIEEVIQIFNLIEQSRKNPSKFGAKSIYCYDFEDIPIFCIGAKNDFDEDNFIIQ